jgi:hypothetical protein
MKGAPLLPNKIEIKKGPTGLGVAGDEQWVVRLS